MSGSRCSARIQRPGKQRRKRKKEQVATGVPAPGVKKRDRGDDLREDNPVMRGKDLSEFNFLGMAHHGMAPDLIADLENLGLDVRGLRGSAESTLRMWERCHEPGRKKLSKAEYAKRMIDAVVAGVT